MAGQFDVQMIREYLLGQIANGIQSELEKSLLTDDQWFEELLVVEDELIDDYLGGKLTADERERFEKHFLSTSERQQKLRFGHAFKKYVSTSAADEAERELRHVREFRPSRPQWSWTNVFSSSPLRIAVSAIVILGLAFGIWRVFFQQSDVDKGLVALNAAYRQQRPVESRISALSYAPFPDTRGPGTDRVNKGQLNRSELTLLDALGNKPRPAVHHALGEVYLAKKQFDEAIKEFEEALKGDLRNPKLLSDLGAAWLEKGKVDLDKAKRDPTGPEGGKGLEELGRSLDSLNKALELDSNLLEALFNRALCHQNMMLPRQATTDWREYLTRDSTSEWAAEAKNNLKLLSSTSAVPATASEVLDSFLMAFQARDDERAWEAISRNKEMITGKFIPQQVAKAYLKESFETTPENADKLLQALIYAGRLELERARDPLITEMATYYSRSSPAQRLHLSQAHARLAVAYNSCLQTQYKEALLPFVEAKALFIKVQDDWEARLCDYWIGVCYSQQDRLHESTTLLASLADYCEKKHYYWLLGQAMCWIANNNTELSEHSKSIENCNRALAIAEEIDDTYNKQKVLAQLGNEYIYMAQPARALDYNWRSLQLMDRRFTSVRQMWRNNLFTARALIALNLYAAGAAYGSEMLSLALNDIKEPGVIHFSYLYLAQIYGGEQKFHEAIQLASESLRVGQSLPDAATSQKLSAGSLRLIAHLQRQAGDFAHALKTYDQAIQSYGQMELSMYRYDAHKGRLLCYAALNDSQSFEAELPTVLYEFEQHRQEIREEQNRNTFFDREQSVYDLAINLAYEKGDYVRALDYSEKSRARSLLAALNNRARASSASGTANSSTPSPPSLTLSEVQGRMPANVQVVEYAVLNDKILIWIVRRDSFNCVKIDISSDHLRDWVSKYVETIASGPGVANNLNEISRDLYDKIITPVAAHLDPEKVLCLVPDKALSYLPFAALISPRSGQYLISEFALLSSPSLNVFLLCSETARRKVKEKSEALLSVGNPSFDPEAYPDLRDLPAAAREAQDIAGNYSPAYSFIGPQALKGSIERRLPDANVVHFAGHYITNERYPLMSRLVLAKQSGSSTSNADADLTAGDLVGRSLPHVKLVVLSACQTGGESYYNGEGMTGISRTFLETGIPLVVASQWSIDSESTAKLMLKFHRYRKLPGTSTIDALRRAQIEMLGEPGGFYRDPYYWAAFLPLGGYADF